MNKRVRIQHFIPRFYLRHFSERNNKRYPIFCFDKRNNKIIDTVVKKAGCEKNFYHSFHDENQFFEKGLIELEKDFSDVFQKLIKRKNPSMLTLKEKRYISLFIAFQDLRTRKQRENLKDYISSISAINFSDTNIEETKKIIKNSIDEEYMQKMQIEFILEYSPIYAQILMSLDWCIFVNSTPYFFWTSDNPIIRYNENTDEFGLRKLSLLDPSIQIHVPLNSSLSLCLHNFKSSLKPSQVIIDLKNVIFLNELQVLNSNRFIFSKNGSFGLAKKMLKNNLQLSSNDLNTNRIRYI